MAERPLILAGPSAVGKTTVAKELMRLWHSFTLLRSATTRPPRNDGNDGEYIYLSRNEFEGLIARGDMLEYMEYAGELYGTPRTELLRAEREGKIPLLILDLVGVESLSHREGVTAPLAVYIYDEPEVLTSRLAERYGTDSQKYRARVEQNARDAENIDAYRHLFTAFVKNDSTPTACAEKIGLNYFSRL